MSAQEYPRGFYNLKAPYILEHCFRQVFIWPEYNPKIHRIPPYLLPIILILLVWILNILHLIYSVKHSLSLLVLEDLLIQFMGITMICIELTLVVKGKLFATMLHAVDDFQQHAVHFEVEEIDRKLLIFSRLLPKVTPPLFLSVMVLCYFGSKFCEKYGVNKDACPMVASMWLPWDSKIVSAVSGFMSLLLSSHITITVALLIIYEIFCVELLIFRIRTLKSLLSKIDFMKSAKAKAQFKTCMKFHSQIISLYNSFNSCVKMMAIPGNIGYSGTVSIATILLYLNPTYRDFHIIVLWSVVLVIQQHEGQRLIDESDSLMDAVYNLNWYDGDLVCQKEVLFFLTVAQRTMQIQFSGFGMLSHATVKDVFSKLFSYLVIIRNIYITDK